VNAFSAANLSLNKKCADLAAEMGRGVQF